MREDLCRDGTVKSGGLLTRGAYNVMPRRISSRGLCGHRLPLAALLKIRSSLGLSLCSCPRPRLSRGPALPPPSGSSLGRFACLIGHSLRSAAALARAPEEFSPNGFADGLATSCSTCTELLIEELPFGSGPFSQSFPTGHSGEDGSSALKVGYVIESGSSLSSTRSFAYSTSTTSEPWETLNLSSLQRLRDPLWTTTCSKYRSDIFSTHGGPPWAPGSPPTRSVCGTSDRSSRRMDRSA